VSSRFPAIVAPGEGRPATLVSLTDAELPDAPITVEIAYSSLNYKDGLAVTGSTRVVRRTPMVCGIDLAGVVVTSRSAEWDPGDEVIATGWGLSEIHPGGYTTRQRLQPEWLVRLPAQMQPKSAMAFGTAGLTAMLCLLALEREGCTPERGGSVVVTGAAGGVGSVAVALLAQAGYRVVASTGRRELTDYLVGLGAQEVIGRDELVGSATTPLAPERFVGAIDTVGGTTLPAAIAQMHYGGVVAACGLAGGSDLPASVFPFILRGVTLAGVDSVHCPTSQREVAWDRLARDVPAATLEAISEVHPMTEVPDLARAVLAGAIRGRIVIDPHG
jgi:putative YhdH/YhfP family quinone oxidoreductase